MIKLLLPLVLVPVICFGATVLETFDAPDTGITALAWGDGVLWAADGTTQYVYEIDPSNGSVLSSFYAMDQTSTYNPVAGGLAYGNGTIYLCMYYASNYGKMYEYDTSGTYQDNFDVYC